MTQKQIRFAIWQKILIIVIFILAGIVLFPPLSFLILYLTYKLIPGDYTRSLALAFPSNWGPLLGAILGILIGIKIALSQRKISKE